MKHLFLVSTATLIVACDSCLAFPAYHATEFRTVAPFVDSLAFNRVGQFSATDSSGNLALWSSQGGTQTIGKPYGLSVSQGAQQALSENGDAAVVAGGLVTSNLFSYRHSRGWETLPYTTDTDVIEMQFYGYSEHDIIAVEGTRSNFPNRIYRYIRVGEEWQLQAAPAAGQIGFIDRQGNIFYGSGLSVVKPYVWKVDGTRVQLSMGAYTNGIVWPLGSDASGRVYGSAWKADLGGSIVRWDTWTSEPTVMATGLNSSSPHSAFVNDYGEMMLSQAAGTSTVTLLWSAQMGLVNIQTLLDNGGEFNSVGISHAFNNLGEALGFEHGLAQRRLLMRPVPEPSSLVLMGAGIGFLAVRRRRR